MGCYDSYCFVCGNRPYSIDLAKYVAEARREGEKTMTDSQVNHALGHSKWMDNCTFLSSNGQILHNMTEVDCNVGFARKGDREHYQADFRDGKGGVWLHTDCWKYISEKYKKKISIFDLPVMLKKHSIKAQDIGINVKYGKIEKYWQQDTDYNQMYLDKNQYMICSPLTNNKKNLARINRILGKYKIKQGERKGPNVSATFYTNGTIKFSNKAFWKKKSGKWTKMKDKLIIKKIFAKDTPKIPEIGLQNRTPKFVISTKWSKTKRKHAITLIGTQKQLNNL